MISISFCPAPVGTMTVTSNPLSASPAAMSLVALPIPPYFPHPKYSRAMKQTEKDILLLTFDS